MITPEGLSEIQGLLVKKDNEQRRASGKNTKV